MKLITIIVALALLSATAALAEPLPSVTDLGRSSLTAIRELHGNGRPLP